MVKIDLGSKRIVRTSEIISCVSPGLTIKNAGPYLACSLYRA